MQEDPGRGNFAVSTNVKRPEHRINHHIRVPRIRLVGDNVEVVFILPIGGN